MQWQWLWNWSGLSFGYRDGDSLWTHDGRHVGQFVGDIVHGRDGRYLGEVRSGNRLITDRSRKSMSSGALGPYANRAPNARKANSAPIAMNAGCEDFPSPEQLR